MAGETNMITEPLVEKPEAPAEPEEANRPVDLAVLMLLERGRQIHEKVGTIRTSIEDVVALLIGKFPGYKKQIAEILEGQSQKLLSDLHKEQLEARRNGSR
jgi:hypothetical protein